MKRIRRFMSALLIAVILSITVASNYTQGATAYAIAIPGIETLTWLMQSVLASRGQSTGSVGDLKALTSAFSDFISACKDGGVSGGFSYLSSVYELHMEANKLETITPGESIDTADFTNLIGGMNEFLDFGLQAAGTRVGSAIAPVPAWTYQDFAKKYLDGYKLKPNLKLQEMFPVGTPFLIQDTNVTNSSKYDKLFVIYYAVDVPDNAYMTFSYLSNDAKRIGLISKKPGKEYRWRRIKLYDSVDDNFDYLMADTSSWGSSVTNKSVLDYFDYNNTSYKSTFVSKYPVIYSGSGLMSSLYGSLKNPYYEDTSNALPLPDKLKVSDLSATETVEQVISNNEGLTEEEISALVTAALADVTAEQQEIKDAVDDNTDAVNTTNGWLSQIFTSIGKNFQKIINLDTGISKAIDKIISRIEKMTDGSGALKLPEDVKDNFTVIEGGGGNTDPDNSDGSGKYVWFPNLVGIAKLLEPIASYFTDPLQLITQALDTLVAYVKQILAFPAKIAKEVGKVIEIPDLSEITEIVKAIPARIAEELGKIIEIPDLGGIIEILKAIPARIAEEVGKVIEIPDLGGIIEIPDLSEIIEILQAIPLRIGEALGNLIEIPDLSEIIEILQAIPLRIASSIGALDLELPVSLPQELFDLLGNVISLPSAIGDAIGSVFAFDMELVDIATEELAETWELKFPFIPAFKQFFTLSFPDSYDYPIIKVQTPTVLKNFIKSDYIILFNGEDFATHFVYVRGILKAIFWVGFAYSLLNRFKVRLHIG